MVSKLFRSSVGLRRFSAVCLAASVLSLAIVPNCYAQFGTGGGTGGGFGGTGGGFGGGGGGFGGGGGGGQGAGNFGAGGNGVVQPEVINVGGETRYIRDQRPAGSFVGADSTDFFGSGAAGAGGLGGAGGLAANQQQLGGQGPRGAAAQGGLGAGGLGGQGGVGGQGQGQGANAILRRNYRIAFEYPAIPANQVATINTRVGQLDSIRVAQQRSGRSSGGLARVRVSRRNGQVVLTGSVSSMEDRALAERLVRLEPDVFQIQNELTVEGSDSEDIQSSRFDDEFPPDEGGYRELPLDEEQPLPSPEPVPTQEQIPPPAAPLQLNPLQLNPLQLDP